MNHALHRPVLSTLVLLLLSPLSLAEDAPLPKSTAEMEMQIMDSDGNARISAMEHTVGAKKIFEAMDANQDGTVTPAEMDKNRRQAMGAHPPKEEFSSVEKIRVVDANQDGELSAEEHFTGSREMFSRMDADGDRNLTLEEIQAGHEKLMGSQDSGTD